MISIRGLHKYFNRRRQNEIHVINNVSLDLPERGMVAIFGKSGCGKTTLLNVIGGLDGFAEGSVYVGGERIGSDTDDIRNRHIGYIFQNYNLCERESCYDNVAAALILAGLTDKDEIRERTEAALVGVGMEKYAKRTPDTLSGGQQQRIAIARAIAKGPSIILADEPTGNLDEANTLMIMDLLRDIANERLVVIVTHEEKLVDRYCDRVIELSDGKVVNVYDNEGATGAAHRSKNDIYLGELQKRSLDTEAAQIEYYGTLPTEPIKLRIVNTGGRMYLKIEGKSLQLIDSSSEVRLCEGCFEDAGDVRAERAHIHALPPIDEQKRGKCGRLFTFLSALKSGWREIMGAAAKSRGKRALSATLILLALVSVFVCAAFGTSIGDLSEAEGAYNHNVFYVYVPDGETSAQLNAALADPNTGIDYMRLYESAWGIETAPRISLKVASFETFDQTYDFSSDFSASGVCLGIGLAKDARVVAGIGEGLSDIGIAISTATAEELIENSTLGYIKAPRDLIGLYADNLRIGGRALRVEGVVEGSEKAIYMNDLSLSRLVITGGAKSLRATPASYAGLEVAPGSAIIAIRDESGTAAYPTVGQTVMMHGKSFKIGGVLKYYYDYGIYLAEKGITAFDPYTLAREAVLATDPDLEGDPAALEIAITAHLEIHYFEYLERHYAAVDDMIRANHLIQPTLESWLYVERGEERVRFLYIPSDMYTAYKYRLQNGRYPTVSELAHLSAEDPFTDLKQIIMQSEEEFYGNNSYEELWGARYYVADSDYIALASSVGETSPTALYESYSEEASYMLLHSSDPAVTAAYLEEHFGHLEPPFEWYDGAIITPDTVREGILTYTRAGIAAGIISMLVMLAVMCLCMYFIMRSSMLTRIKEIGIYRAIGVRRGNIIGRFLAEAGVQTALTVFIGYALASAFIRVASDMSSLFADLMFYPWHMALTVLAVLITCSLVFGILPVCMLLNKTPSAIIAKYDI